MYKETNENAIILDIITINKLTQDFTSKMTSAKLAQNDTFESIAAPSSAYIRTARSNVENLVRRTHSFRLSLQRYNTNFYFI